MSQAIVNPATLQRLVTIKDAAIKALSELDDIATSPASMGMEDIEDLCKARELLANALEYVYNHGTNRFEPGE